MSEELQSMVQIIELYGRGLGALGRAIRFSAKGAAKGVDVAKVKTMQCKMKLYYASTGKHKTMKLSGLEKLTGGEYIPVSFDVETEVLADSPNIYAVVLPGVAEDGEANLRCAIINKADTRLSEDGKSVTAYLKHDGKSVLMVFNGNEEKIKEYSQKNEVIVAVCLKQQRERSGQSVAPKPGLVQGVSKSIPQQRRLLCADSAISGTVKDALCGWSMGRRGRQL